MSKAALTLLLIIIATFHAVIFLGKTFETTTLVSGVMPSGPYGYHFSKASLDSVGLDAGGSAWQIRAETEKVAQSLRAGNLPLWNPHQMLGTPLATNLQLSAFFPLRFLSLFVPFAIAGDLYRILLLFLASFFTFLFLKQRAMSRSASLVGGLTYALGGSIAQFTHFPFIDILAFMPFAFFWMDRLTKRRNWGSVLGLGVSVGLLLLSGYPGALIASMFFLTAYGGICVLGDVKLVRFLFLSALVGLLLGAITLLPGLELLQTTTNNRAPGMALGHYPFPALIGLAFPNISSSLSGLPPFPGWIGVVPIVLATFGLLSRRKGSLFFSIVAILLCLKLGGLPPGQWLGYLPVLSRVALVRYALPILAFCLAVLSGYGFDHLNQTSHPKRDMGLAVAFWIVCLVLVLSFFSPVSNDWVKSRLLQRCLVGLFFCVGLFLVSSRKSAVLLVGLTALELFTHHQRVYSTRYDPFTPAPYLKVLQSDPERFRLMGLDQVLYPPYSSAFNLDDVRWMNAIVNPYYKRFVNEFFSPRAIDRFTGDEDELVFLKQDGSFTELANLSGIKYLLRGKPHTNVTPYFDPIRLKKIYDNEIEIYQNERALPRAFWVPSLAAVPDDSATVAYMKSEAFNPRNEVVTSEQVEPVRTEKAPGQPTQVELLSYGDSEVLLKTSGNAPGYLVLTDLFHPHWNAFLDDKPWPVWRAYLAFRGMTLPAGEHRVRFVYQNPFFTLGAWISILTTVGVLCVALIKWRNSGLRK